MRLIKKVTALKEADATSTDQYSPAINIQSYEFISIVMAGSNTAVFKVRTQGACGLVAPTFSSAAALDNEWDFIDVIDYEDGTSLDGDDGVTFAADGVQQYSLNVDGLDWISFKVATADHTTGKATVRVFGYNNQ